MTISRKTTQPTTSTSALSSSSPPSSFINNNNNDYEQHQKIMMSTASMTTTTTVAAASPTSAVQTTNESVQGKSAFISSSPAASSAKTTIVTPRRLSQSSTRSSLSSSYGGISPSDRAAIDQLRKIAHSWTGGLMSEYYDTDFNLLRWLQTYNYDLDSLLPMLQSHLRLRKGASLDTNCETPWPCPEHGVYKNHWLGAYVPPVNPRVTNVVAVEFLGSMDIPNFIKTISGFGFVQSRAADYEKMLGDVMDMEERTGRQGYIVDVIDMEGFHITSEMIAVIKGPLKCLSIFAEENWPGLTKQIILINVPTSWLYVWKVVRPILNEKTAKKVVFLGTDWRIKLPKLVNMECLPQAMGGTGVVPNWDFLHTKQRIPESSWFSKSEEYKHPWPGSDETFVIKAGKCVTKTLHVDQINTKIAFRFTVTSESSVAVYFTENEFDRDWESQELAWWNLNRFPGASNVTNVANITVKQRGYYTFFCSNKWSWWYNIKLRLGAQIIPPVAQSSPALLN